MAQTEQTTLTDQQNRFLHDLVNGSVSVSGARIAALHTEMIVQELGALDALRLFGTLTLSLAHTLALHPTWVLDTLDGVLGKDDDTACRADTAAA